MKNLYTSKITSQVGSVVVGLMIISAPFLSFADTLNRSLGLGSTGSDVSALQSFLAKDATLYPQGLVTGYFGALTKTAVANFQARNGISPVGVVGPVTLPVLNAQMSGGSVVTPGNAPLISSLNVSTYSNSAMVAWNTNEMAKGVVYYSVNALTTYEHENSVDVSGNIAFTDSNFRTTQGVSIQNLASNTTYYYMVYTTDQNGNVTVTVPATFHTN